MLREVSWAAESARCCALSASKSRRAYGVSLLVVLHVTISLFGALPMD